MHVAYTKRLFFVVPQFLKAPRGASQQGCQKCVFKSRRLACTESPLLLASVISRRYNTMLWRLGSLGQPRSPSSSQVTVVWPQPPRGQAQGHQQRLGPKAVPTATRMVSGKVCFSLGKQRFWSLGQYIQNCFGIHCPKSSRFT